MRRAGLWLREIGLTTEYRNKDYMEEDLAKCKKCQDIKLRKRDGKYPDGRNTKFVDAGGRQWNGRVCPGCQGDKAREQIKAKRAKAKVEA